MSNCQTEEREANGFPVLYCVEHGQDAKDCAPRNDLTLPLYATKPQRRIPGTRCIAVTLYKSDDGSVAQYAILTDDGQAHIGKAFYQPKRRFHARGYAMVQSPTLRDETFRNLTEFATEIGDRLGLDVRA